MVADAPANPCGLIAKSFFTDTYKLYSDSSLSTQITINEKDIAWENDVGTKFKRCKNSD